MSCVKSGLHEVGCYHTVRELNSASALQHKIYLARELARVIKGAGGRMGRVEALSSTATNAGTTVNEMLYGLSLGLSRKIFAYNADASEIMTLI